jgi:hypothetical protein
VALTTYIVRGVQPYDLHGTKYFRILYSERPDAAVVHEARLAHDAVYDGPAVGDRIVVHTVLSTVTSIDRAPDEFQAHLR